MFLPGTSIRLNRYIIHEFSNGNRSLIIQSLTRQTHIGLTAGPNPQQGKQHCQSFGANRKERGAVQYDCRV
jgi:hypothetical protein